MRRAELERERARLRATKALLEGMVSRGSPSSGSGAVDAVPVHLNTLHMVQAPDMGVSVPQLPQPVGAAAPVAAAAAAAAPALGLTGSGAPLGLTRPVLGPGGPH